MQKINDFNTWIDTINLENKDIINLMKVLEIPKYLICRIAGDHTIIHYEDINESDITNFNEFLNRSPDAITSSSPISISKFPAPFSEWKLGIEPMDNERNYTIFVDPNNVNNHVLEFIPLGIKYFDLMNQVETLHNTMKTSIKEDSSRSKEMTDLSINQLPESFLDETIPTVFYSVVDEVYGPKIIKTEPNVDASDYTLTVVNIFSGLDSEMVCDIGHVFTNFPIKMDNINELFNIIFAVPSKNARGGYEIHGISAIVGQDFVQSTKSILDRLKSSMFWAVEQIRILIEENNWELGLGQSFDEINTNELDVILDNTRKQLAMSFAEIMNPDDVINF